MLLNTEDYRRRSASYLPQFVFDYVDGHADDGHCLRRNIDDLAKIELCPRVLKDVSHIDTSVQVFGQTWRFPFAIAPTGLNGLIRPQGDLTLAKAAARKGIPFTLSTASNMRLEDIRDGAQDGIRWMQLYVMHREMAGQIVKRARNAGYQALVLTVDVPVSGNRERDARNGFTMPFRPTPRLAWDLATHPAWTARLLASGAPDFANLTAEGDFAGSTEMQAALLARAMDRSLEWTSIDWLRRLWDGPLLLKGILHPEDARLALRHGIDGIVVSNHGGRQNDASPSAIAALPGVVEAIEGRIPVFMDGGVRRGADIAKAISLGARAVFIGRPVLYGLAAGGAEGTDAVLNILERELTRTMTLLGATRLDELAVNAARHNIT